MKTNNYGIGEREIKFRAWDEKYMRFDEDFNIHSIYKSQIYDKEKVDPIMQYTGLKDNQGKEVYEGDIVLFDSMGDGEIIWEQAVVTFSDYEWRAHYSLNDEWGYKVIGNIFENPELLTTDPAELGK